jgi:hypothetical protein
VQAELVFTLEQLRSTAMQKEHAEEELATAWDDLTHTKNQVVITQRALLAMEGEPLHFWALRFNHITPQANRVPPT